MIAPVLYYASKAESGCRDLPIFVMRPLRGQFAQSTHSVVEHMRLQGDTFVYWLDTSGWLNAEIDPENRTEEQDFYIDESPLKQWRLTERGNQRVAILLHKHMCKYLAQDTASCVVLPSETDHGQILEADVE